MQIYKLNVEIVLVFNNLLTRTVLGLRLSVYRQLLHTLFNLQRKKHHSHDDIFYWYLKMSCTSI